MATSYTKLRDGSWGIRGTGLTAGESVEVVKKDGSRQQETVGKVLWTGADGTMLATIVAKPRSSGSRETRSCWECGRDFTYAECRRNDGDWGDSYCGC